MMAAPFLTSPDLQSFNKLQMSSAGLNEWFDSDFSGFLSQELTQEVVNIDFPTTHQASPISDYPTPSPELFVPSDSSAYSSDSSETHSPYDQFSTDSAQSGVSSPIDEILFEPFNIADPLLVPEIEKILASSSYQIEVAQPIVPEPAPTTSSRKRKMEAPVDKAPVTLSRDKLLTMTSKEIEDYVSELKTKRSLTAAEEKELKRQRRLVKNREYASQSRSRKKVFVEDLEKQLEAARAEADEYKKQNSVLAEENKILRRQLGSIADTIKKVQQNGGATSKSSANLSASSGNVGVFDRFLKVGAGRSAVAPTKGVSACLLAIFFMVFTFAAFWDNESQFSKRESITFRSRDLSEFEGSIDTSLWEAATDLLRSSWEVTSEYLPSWDTAYALFVANYPNLFTKSSSPSDVSSAPIPPKSTNDIPCELSSNGCSTHPPPSSLPSANKTHRCGMHVA